MEVNSHQRNTNRLKAAARNKVNLGFKHKNIFFSNCLNQNFKVAVPQYVPI